MDGKIHPLGTVTYNLRIDIKQQNKARCWYTQLSLRCNARGKVGCSNILLSFTRWQTCCTCITFCSFFLWRVVQFTKKPDTLGVCG